MHLKSNQPQPKFQLFLLLALFAVSGAAGLIYEVVWVRQLTQVLGASSYAVTIVLVSFMLGLGLGAWILGRRADALDAGGLVKAYALLEVGIAAYALAFPFLLMGAEGLYVKFFRALTPEALPFHTFKLVLALVLLTLPTTLMGATLPVLGRYLIRKKGTIASRLSWLYAANTTGAILGTLLAGYTLLPAIGVQATTLVAIGFNLAAALGLIAFHKRYRNCSDQWESVQISTLKTGPRMSSLQWATVCGFGISGVAAMFYQIAWNRTLSMILGNTTFAFTTMLATFLTGIAAGSALFGLWPARRSKAQLLVGIQLLAGFAALLTIPLFEKLPVLYLSLHEGWVDSWMSMQILRFALAALVMLPTTVLLGATFPAVSALLVEDMGSFGREVGRAYALNTLGAVAGAALAGLILIPLIGMQKTIILGALLNVAAGLGICLLIQQTAYSRRMATIAAASLALVVTLCVIQPWSPRILNSGVYLYASRYQDMEERVQLATQDGNSSTSLTSWDIWEMGMRQYDLLYYKPGVAATVAVMERSDGVRFLTIDGKTDASTGEKSDMRTQVMIGQLPLLFHEDPDKVLVVGLGSGVTVGSALTHDVRMVDCAEISPGVIEAAHYFRDANHNPFKDNRLRIIPRDARNVLLTGEEKYDVIISQPSNPWIKGEAALFTEEWYQLVKENLGRNGLFLQWVPSYLMEERDLKVIAHTLRSVFPHLTVWSSGSVGDLVFLAQKGSPLQIDVEKFLDRVQKPQVASDIERVGLSPDQVVFSLFRMGEKDLLPYLYADPGQALHKNTDDWLTIEFTTPKQLVRRKNITRFTGVQKDSINLASLREVIKQGNTRQFGDFIDRLIKIEGQDSSEGEDTESI